MQLSSQEWERTREPFSTVQRLTLTPSSTTTPAPMVTLGPMVQFSPIFAVGSCGSERRRTWLKARPSGCQGDACSATAGVLRGQRPERRWVSYHKDVAKETGPGAQPLGRALPQGLEVHAHPLQEVFGLPDVHPEP